MEKSIRTFLANPIKHESVTFMYVSERKLTFNFTAFEYLKVNHTIFFRKWEEKNDNGWVDPFIQRCSIKDHVM